MDNNNGRGIFYGVMGVATLIVTIIGATFAYFAAATNSATNAIRTTGAVVTLGWKDISDNTYKSTFGTDTQGVFNVGDLIPVDANGEGGVANYENFKFFPVTTGSGTDIRNCLDADGNRICSLFTFEVSNLSTTSAQTIYLYLGVTSNTFGNLHYAVFRGKPADVDASTNKWNVVHSATADSSTVNAIYSITGATGNMVHVDSEYLTPAQPQTAGTAGVSSDLVYITNSKQILAPSTDSVNSKTTYTIITWLQETGHNQTSDDSGKTLDAFIYATTTNPETLADPDSETAYSGITGNLSLVNPGA